VWTGIQLLKEHHITPEILCVVNSENVKHPHLIYDFFKRTGVEFITFIPLVIPVTSSPGGITKSSVPAKEFGNFLVEIFDEWVVNDIGKIKIQVFEEAIRTAFNQEHTLCIFKVNCGTVPVVEQNGDFYSCDHYVNYDHMLGNISDDTLSSYIDSKRQVEFGTAKSLALPEYCTKCEVRPMCNGECPKNRFIFTPDGEYGLNYLCEGYKHFFNHCHPFVEAVAEEWKRNNLLFNEVE
jgi:uncharacterized protein